MTYEPFQERILDHYRHPRNYGDLDPADATARDVNPVCGDEVRLSLRFDGGGRITNARFTGRGCVLSQASASLLTERVRGATAAEVDALGRDEVLGMLGVPISPVRERCVLLPLQVLRSAIAARGRAS